MDEIRKAQLLEYYFFGGQRGHLRINDGIKKKVLTTRECHNCGFKSKGYIVDFGIKTDLPLESYYCPECQKELNVKKANFIYSSKGNVDIFSEDEITSEMIAIHHKYVHKYVSNKGE